MSVCVGVCRGFSRFVKVCRGLSRLDEVCRGLSGFDEPWGYIMPCVCAHVCVWVCLSGFVEVCRGLSRFVEPGGHMMPAFEIVNCLLYIVPILVNTAFCL